MLLLTFQVDGQQYAIDAKSVVEVIPQVKLRPLPGTAAFVGGVFNYRGTLVPVIDVTRMLSGRRTQEQLSARIILVSYPEGGENVHTLGLLTEKSTEIVERDKGTFADTGIENQTTPWLGKIAVDGKSMIQFVRIENLLPDELKNTLFKQRSP